MIEYPVINKDFNPDDLLLLDGFIILIDKEDEWSSFDVVKKLRGALRVKKVGHAGTLDPFATGLLVILFGKATKTADLYSSQNKVYHCVVKLGSSTNSFDRTGEVTNTSDAIPEKDRITEVINSFIGHQEQLPPMFSAIKVNGKRLYKSAREGIEVERKTRQITINSIDIISIGDDTVEMVVDCTKGTYVRSLADDIGTKLGCYAHLQELRRIKSGEFDIKDAFTVSELLKKVKSN
ncbi:MAG: tRNA pseudouridine(55) synthase TruB [Candidatus Delongbacteria bacterium]|jgi:tRNA pseudouridine55 synthase|nr:tRNA pseudouridine(55) synthase TruB [Candidatus Delongbacteria bacterium]